MVADGLIGERRIQGRVVDIVALDALKEHSKAAANHSLSISREIVGKANSRLPSVVLVLNVATREPTNSSFPDAIEIELLAASG